MSSIVDPRRAPRVSARCAVEVRDRESTWTGETEDVGPRGCQLLLPVGFRVGRLVTLSMTSPLVHRPLVVAGQVAWSRLSQPARMGIAYAGVLAPSGSPSTEAWFEQLCASEMSLRLRSGPRALDEAAVVYLASPPGPGASFGPQELRLLRQIGRGSSVRDLLRAAGAEKLAPHLFALFSKRAVTLVRPAAADPAQWQDVIAEAETRAAASDIEAAQRRAAAASSAPPALQRAAASGAPPVLHRGAAPASPPLDGPRAADAPGSGPAPAPLVASAPAPVASPASAPTPRGTRAPPALALVRGGGGAPPRRSPEAQFLYERGVELLVAGNSSAAEGLFRSAAAMAPDDPVLTNVLRRFATR